MLAWRLSKLRAKFMVLSKEFCWNNISSLHSSTHIPTYLN
jgi:hypothetical protein